MAAMTWGECKALVEAAGVEETDTILHIEIRDPDQSHPRTSIEVSRDAETHSFQVT